MTLPPIVQTGAPVLRGAAHDVDPARLHTPEFRDLVQTMLDVMRKAPGVGLAAPQIGIPLRLIVLEDREEFLAHLSPEENLARGRVAFPTRIFVNPVLTPIGDETAIFYVGLVERHLEVEVSGLDENGAPQTWRVRGWPARILQHEVDHIGGTLYIDRMKTRSFTTVDQAKEHYINKSIAEIISALQID